MLPEQGTSHVRGNGLAGMDLLVYIKPLSLVPNKDSELLAKGGIAAC